MPSVRRIATVAALAAALAASTPAGAAPPRGEIVLRGTAGAVTATFPTAVRLLLPDSFVPAHSGNVRGVVVREATGGLVLAAASVELPGVGRVPVLQRGQGYEGGRLSPGRYRFSLIGDAPGADIVVPVEGLAGRRVLSLTGALHQRGVAHGDPAGGSSSYRAGPIGVRPGVGLIYAWVAERGPGVHDVDFCMVPRGATCPEGNPPEVVVGQRRFAGVHVSAPSARPPGIYDIVLRTTSVGVAGPAGMLAWTFL